jgi:hypothetical protein
MRQSQRKKIWLPLIHGCANQASYECHRCQERIGKVKQGENDSNESNTFQPFSQRELSPAIDEAVQRVLLKQGPDWQRKVSCPEVSGKYRVAHEPAGRNYHEDRRGRWQQKQPTGSEKVVSTKSYLVKRFAAVTMGERHQAPG